MRKGYAIEVTFDPETAGRIAELWEAIARARVSTFMKDVGAFPHISLAVFDHLDCETMGDPIGELARSTPPIEISLSVAGTFPGPDGVVFVAPVATPELLAMHARLHTLFSGRGFVPWNHYRPGAWFPHCTVAMELDPVQICEAIAICRASKVFGKGRLTGISLVEFRPVCELCAFPLGAHPQDN